jgi:hypothetical protein
VADEVADGERPGTPTHAVILTGPQRIDVPRVAQIVARAAHLSAIDAAGRITRGMGIVLETNSVGVATETARQLTANRLPAAVVDLARLPAWVETAIVAAEIRVDGIRVWTPAEETLDFDPADIVAIAHARVSRSLADADPPLRCIIYVRRPPLLLTAGQAFEHRTPGAEPTLHDFALRLARRAPHARRDAGLHQTVVLEKPTCLRFAGDEQFAQCARWVMLSAFAG